MDVLSAHGVKDVVCSPGSRNTPLLIASAARENFRKHIVVDERSAAFMALGLSLVSRRPVALICTSGTALLNYSPAIAEAYYQGIPLIVISADRPEQWIDQDDSQTLRQFDALRNFVKNSYELPAFGEEQEELQWYANRITNDAMMTATGQKPGPVHINIRLNEPLGLKGEFTEKKERVIKLLSADTLGNREELNHLARELSESKVMLVAGFMPPDSKMQRVISELAGNENFVIMAETISNLHLPYKSSSVDSVLSSYDDRILDEHIPDIIISIGGAIVSRKLKEYLRRNSKRIHHWSPGFHHTTVDCFKSLSLRIEVDPFRFLRYMANRLKKSGVKDSVNDFNNCWRQLRENALNVKQRFIHNSPWSELNAFDIILNSIPQNYNLFLSNGTAIRYAQIIDYKLPHGSYCNRGVSGIDGSISTAIGGAKAYGGPTLIITGDLSMAYDISSLSLPNIPETTKIIVIDNQGGGIFRFIPSTSELEEREEYFCACPSLPLKQLAEGYGWEYMNVDNETDLKHFIEKFLSSDHKTILKVNCPPVISSEVLKNYFAVKVVKDVGK